MWARSRANSSSMSLRSANSAASCRMRSRQDTFQLLRENVAFLGTHGVQAFHGGLQRGRCGQFNLGLLRFFRAGSFHGPNTGESKGGVQIRLHASYLVLAAGGAKGFNIGLD